MINAELLEEELKLELEILGDILDVIAEEYDSDIIRNVTYVFICDVKCTLTLPISTQEKISKIEDLYREYQEKIAWYTLN